MFCHFYAIIVMISVRFYKGGMRVGLKTKICHPPAVLLAINPNHVVVFGN